MSAVQKEVCLQQYSDASGSVSEQRKKQGLSADKAVDTEIYNTDTFYDLRDDNESVWSQSTEEDSVSPGEPAEEGFIDLLLAHTETQESGRMNDLDEAEDEDEDQGLQEPHTVRYAELTIAFMRKLQRRQTKFVTWESLLSTVSYAGRKNMTATQYNYLRDAVLAANSHLSFRTYKTLRTTFWSDIKKVSFPKMYVHYLGRNVHQRPRRKMIKSVNSGEKNVEDCAVIVLPSEWAKIDVLSYHFYRDVYESDHIHRPMSIEKSPIVQHRRRVNNEKETLWAEFKNACCPTEMGDVIRFPCNAAPAGVDVPSIGNHWRVETTTTVEIYGERTTEINVHGCTGPLWMVDNRSCAPKEIRSSWNLSEEEISVYDTLQATTPTMPRMTAASGEDCGTSIQTT